MASPKARILEALTAMPEEAFTWLVLACLPSAMPNGAAIQIWPDGIGGFTADSRDAIQEVRTAAADYLADLQAHGRGEG